MHNQDLFLKEHLITINFYVTDTGLHNYFIFINQKVVSKAAFPHPNLEELTELAFQHCLEIIKSTHNYDDSDLDYCRNTCGS